MSKVCGWISLLIVALVFFHTACDRRSQAVFVGEPRAGDTRSGPSMGKDAKPKGESDSSSQRKPIPAASPEQFEFAIAVTARLVNPRVDGSGVLLHRDEEYLYLLTAWHVARENISRIDLFSVEQQEPVLTLPAPDVVTHSERLDLALLRVRTDSEYPFRTVTFSADTNPQFGYSVGCTGGKFPTMLPERITGEGEYRVEGSAVRGLLWTTDKPQSAGRSGGPLLDVKGRLLGIALGKKGSVGFYCHRKEISGYLIDSPQKGLVTWPKLNKN